MSDKKPSEILIPSEFARLLDDDWREALVEGGRYSLKSHTVARILIIKAMNSKKRVLCGREFQNSIAESVHQLFVDIIELYKIPGWSITRDSITYTPNGSDFIFKGVRHNMQSIKSLEGVDIFWGEESQTFSKESIDVLTPTIRKSGSQLIWTMNRLLELDPIYVRFTEGLPNAIHIKANYDVAEKYGWLPKEIKDEIEYDKEFDPGLYTFKWLGEPMSQVDDAILGREQVMQSMDRSIQPEGAFEIGVDVARMGNDRTELVMRQGWKEVARQTYKHLRTTEVCDKAQMMIADNVPVDPNDKRTEAQKRKDVLIKVDDTGVGGGVSDELILRGYNVIPINFGSSASDKDKYPNLISEAWFYMREVIGDVQLVKDSDLLMELSSRKWVMDSKGRRGVESKDIYKKRGYRSPDKADATILCFYTPQLPSVQILW